MRTILLLMFCLFSSMASSRDLGQWENTDPETHEWYQGLMMPDYPAVSCCKEADAYWCDDIHVKDGKTYCRITDDRDDKPLGRPHRELGQQYEIPDYKLKYDRGNPTGHTILFIGVNDVVYCFVQNSGI